MRERIDRFLTSGWTGQPSTKRLVVFRATMALIIVFIALGGACAYRIARFGDLGAGALGALTFVGGILAALGGVAYRKPEVGVSAPTTGGGDAPPSDPGAPSGGSLG